MFENLGEHLDVGERVRREVTKDEDLVNEEPPSVSFVCVCTDDQIN